MYTASTGTQRIIIDTLTNRQTDRQTLTYQYLTKQINVERLISWNQRQLLDKTLQIESHHHHPYPTPIILLLTYDMRSEVGGVVA
jgi:hypothetical protein